MLNRAFTSAILLFLVFLCLGTMSFAQKDKPLSEDAQKALSKEVSAIYSTGNYKASLDKYLLLQKSNIANTEYNYRVGMCYLNTDINKTAAAEYLEMAANGASPPKDTYYQLGRAYHYNHQFDEAISAYQKFREVSGGKIAMKPDVNRLIEMCENGKFFIKKPVNCDFVNLGKMVNTVESEYNPIISGDETTLIYSSKRKTNTGATVDDAGIPTSDIFISTLNDGVRTKAKNMGTNVNTMGDDRALSLSSDGTRLFIRMEETKGDGDIYMSELKGKTFQKAEKLSASVNSKDDESGACLTPDGLTLYFASNRKGGKGGKDLYMSKKLPNGEWGTAVNMGNDINSAGDEDNPTLSPDGKTLFYSTDGFESMGGSDIYRCQWSEVQQSWSRPENLGYPINSAMDDLSFSVAASGKFGYLASARKGGSGDMDIYRITLHHVDKPDPAAIYRITLNNPYPDKPMQAKAELKTKEGAIAGVYTADPKSGKFTMIIAPGQYQCNLTSNGFISQSLDITIPYLTENMEVNKFIIMILDQE
jgi:hypothetical protein